MNQIALFQALISSVLVLMIFSFVYRHNRWFALASAIYIGGASANATARAIRIILDQGVTPILQGKPWFILSLILGALLFTRFTSGYRWWVRVPTAVLLGTGIGLNMATGMKAQILAQIIDTMRPITSLNNIIIIVGVITVMLFFLFSKETTGIMYPINKTGRYFLMIALGSSFAYALLGRTSLLIERFKGLISYPSYFLIPIAIAVIVYDIFKRRETVQGV
jgi:hypothetical protein